MLIGPDFKPHYAGDQGKDLGVTTWPPRHGKSAAARRGGGSPSMRSSMRSITGIGNPGPWNQRAAARR